MEFMCSISSTTWVLAHWANWEYVTPSRAYSLQVDDVISRNLSRADAPHSPSNIMLKDYEQALQDTQRAIRPLEGDFKPYESINPPPVFEPKTHHARDIQRAELAQLLGKFEYQQSDLIQTLISVSSMIKRAEDEIHRRRYAVSHWHLGSFQRSHQRCLRIYTLLDVPMQRMKTFSLFVSHLSHGDVFSVCAYLVLMDKHQPHSRAYLQTKYSTFWYRWRWCGATPIGGALNNLPANTL